jgi:hypothetical protein
MTWCLRTAPGPRLTSLPAGCCGSDRRCIERQTQTLPSTAVLVNNSSGVFRCSDFWRSRRGSLSRADVVAIPRLVRPNPTAGSAVICPAATVCASASTSHSKFPVTNYSKRDARPPGRPRLDELPFHSERTNSYQKFAVLTARKGIGPVDRDCARVIQTDLFLHTARCVVHRHRGRSDRTTRRTRRQPHCLQNGHFRASIHRLTKVVLSSRHHRAGIEVGDCRGDALEIGVKNGNAAGVGRVQRADDDH